MVFTVSILNYHINTNSVKVIFSSSYFSDSMLLLRVEPNSAGNYTCSSHKSNTATVSINVVHGISIKKLFMSFIYFTFQR